MFIKKCNKKWLQWNVEIKIGYNYYETFINESICGIKLSIRGWHAIK